MALERLEQDVEPTVPVIPGTAGDRSDDAASDQDHEPSPPAADPESTVGTGSVLGIGCLVLMLIVLGIGLAIFFSRQVR